MGRDSSIFYNSKIETISRNDLEALQLAKLKWQVDRCYHRSEFYRERFDAAGVSPADVKTLDDIRKLPFVQKEELREEQAQHPFFGEIHRRTTGRVPGGPPKHWDNRYTRQYNLECYRCAIHHRGNSKNALEYRCPFGGCCAERFCVWALGGRFGCALRQRKNRLSRYSNRRGIDRKTD